MSIKNLLIKLLNFIKSKFKIKTADAPNDILLNISNSLSDILKLCQTNSCDDSISKIVALRHCRNITEAVNTMRFTSDLELFNNKYDDVKLLLNKISALHGVDDKIIKKCNDIQTDLQFLCASPEEKHDDNIVYYGVTFGNKSKEYYYRCENQKFPVGQYVAVPVQTSIEKRVARISHIYEFTPTNVPMPTEKVKIIIGPAIPNRMK